MDLRSQDWGPPHLHLHLNPSSAQAQGCPRRKKDSTSKKTHPLNPRRQKNSSRKKTKDLMDLAQWTWTRRRKGTWTEEEELLALDQDLGTTQFLPLARGLPNPMLPHPSPSLLSLPPTRRQKNSSSKKIHPLNPRRQKNPSRKKTLDLVDLAQDVDMDLDVDVDEEEEEDEDEEEEVLLALDQDLGTTQLLPLARGLPNPMLLHPSPALLSLPSTRRKKIPKKINQHTNLHISKWLQSLIRTHNAIMPLTNSHTHAQTHRHIH